MAPIDVEADLAERGAVEMPVVVIMDVESEASERSVGEIPVVVTIDVEVP